METTKETENLIRQAIADESNPFYRETVKAISRCLTYWETEDYLHNGHMSEIFRFLYLDTDTFSLTSKEKSKLLHVSIKTLDRYRKDFVSVFLYYCEHKEEDSLCIRRTFEKSMEQ